MSVREQLNSIAEKRILVLDGAMGSTIQALHLNEKDFRGSRFAEHSTPLEGCNDLLCLTKPEAVTAIHNAYLDAGADIIETCSFNSTSVSLSDYGIGHLAYEISLAAAKIAQDSAEKYSALGKPRFVAGSIGPTAKGASLYPDINNPGKRSICWDELEAAYYDNARGLLDGGADILLIETVFDTLNAKAALFAINRLLNERKTDIPVMISAAVAQERLIAGQNLEAFCISLLNAPLPGGNTPWAIGLNCALNAEKLLPFVRTLSEIAPCFVFAQPNAGQPNNLGRYDETPGIMTANIENYFKEGLVNIIGSCCGSTSAHTASIVKKAANYKPRCLPAVSGHGFLSGLNPLHLKDGAIHIPDTANVKEFFRLLGEGGYEDAVDTARDMVDEGAEILNIKTNDEKILSNFLDYALMNPYVAKVPFFINSSSINTLQTGLKRLQGKGLAGPVSLKDGDAEFLRKIDIIRRYGAVAAVTLIDGNGQAKTFERKKEIAGRIFNLLKENKYHIEDIVFAMFEFSGADKDSICSWIRDNCPGAVLAV
jgi:5-methyltetrahydrofolate--homocysteine methyltransferase